MIKEIARMGVEVCCTLGALKEHQAARLKEAGLYAYNHNLDSSEHFYKIKKVSLHCMETYSLSLMLGGISTLHYLTALDVKTCQYLKEKGLSKNQVKEAAYLLVTYAIELRADELYRIYDEILRKTRSKVAVKSILLEEKEHLNEMIEGLEQLSSGFVYAEYICAMEALSVREGLRLACMMFVYNVL